MSESRNLGFHTAVSHGTNSRSLQSFAFKTIIHIMNSKYISDILISIYVENLIKNLIRLVRPFSILIYQLCFWKTSFLYPPFPIYVNVCFTGYNY